MDSHLLRLPALSALERRSSRGIRHFNGTVGVNVAATPTPLTVKDTGLLGYHDGIQIQRDGPPSQQGYINVAGGALTIVSSDPTTPSFGAIYFLGDNGTSQNIVMDVDGAGNVGIGTTSPQYTLDVTGTITNNTASPIFYATGNGQGAASGNQIALHSPGAYYGTISNDTTNSWSLGYVANPYNTSTNDVLSWTASGNVGIGTTAPAHTFEVQGSTYADSAAFVWSGTQNIGGTIAQDSQGVGGGGAQICGGGQGGMYQVFDQSTNVVCTFFCSGAGGSCNPYGPAECTASGINTGTECVYLSGQIRCYNYSGATRNYHCANFFVQ